jgi:hypothetical protein
VGSRIEGGRGGREGSWMLGDEGVDSHMTYSGGGVTRDGGVVGVGSRSIYKIVRSRTIGGVDVTSK